MFRLLEAIFRLNIKEKKIEPKHVAVKSQKKKKIHKVVLDCILSLYLIIGSKHNGDALS